MRDRTRREFFALAGCAAGSLFARSTQAATAETTSPYGMVAKIDRKRILAAASQYLSAQPVTVTAAHSERSAGGPHDYFSEGDYWWPDEKNPKGPYIRRDGLTNPQNFNDHREAMVRLSRIVPALTAAWELTNDKRYSEHAGRHLRAWFV